MKLHLLTRLVATVLATIALGAFATPAQGGTLYTNNYTAQQLVGLSIGNDGLLTLLPGSPLAVGHYASGIGVTPDGRFLVTSFTFNTDNLLTTNALAPAGSISGVPSASVSADVAGAPAVSPDGRFVYVSAGGGGVLAYRLGGDGSLTAIGGPYGSGDGEVPALTPDGRFLLLPDYSGGDIERLAVQGDGSLAPFGTTPAGTTGGEVIRVTPDGRFALLLSGDGSGEIRSFAIGADGSLTATGSAVPTSGGTSGLPVISPNGRFYHHPNVNGDSITTYAIAVDGTLSQVGEPVPAGVEDPESVAMSADGRFLYVSPYSGEVMQAFSAGTDGSLTKIGPLTSIGGASDGSTPIPRPAAPTARFTAEAGAPGGKTVFDATASFDLGATLSSYAWNFGDGTSLGGNDPKPSHVFKKAGVYKVTLIVGDDANCLALVYTGQTAYCDPFNAATTVTVDTLPAISKLKVENKSFATASISKAKAKKPGTTFSYRLSEKADVVFTVQRKRFGRKVGKKCKPAKQVPKKGKCTLLRKLGSFKAKGKVGKNATRFSGRIKGRPLKPGSYVATAVATDRAGGKSAPRSVGFEVTKPVRPATAR